MKTWDDIQRPEGRELDVSPINVQPIQLTETDQAKRLFLHDAQNIAGVLEIATYGGKTLAEQSISVVVPGLFSHAARQVYELKTRVYQLYPDADLDVSVKVPRDLSESLSGRVQAATR